MDSPAVRLPKARTDHQHVELLFIYHVAPILRKLKPAALIPAKPKFLDFWEANQQRVCRLTNLSVCKIERKNQTSLLLIYDKEEIKTTLANEKASLILSQYGYPNRGDVEQILHYLKSRFMKVKFPHEVGIFLGYPPDDVKGFIDNNGRNFHCCRYWKAYCDAEKAQKVWKQIDEAHMYALKLLDQHTWVQCVVDMLKQS